VCYKKQISNRRYTSKYGYFGENYQILTTTVRDKLNKFKHTQNRIGGRILITFLRLMIPVILSAATFSTSYAIAAPIPQDKIMTYNPYNVVTLELRRITQIYNQAGDTHPIAALAPQTLMVIEAKDIYDNPWGTWYKVGTWLGDKWIYSVRSIERPTTFTPKQVKATIVVPLYDEPFIDTKTQCALAPQTIQVNGLENGLFYKVKTWLGDKYITTSVDPHGGRF
jgi:hypothetical protein